jgi:hypothetical protein
MPRPKWTVKKANPSITTTLNTYAFSVSLMRLHSSLLCADDPFLWKKHFSLALYVSGKTLRVETRRRCEIGLYEFFPSILHINIG